MSMLLVVVVVAVSALCVVGFDDFCISSLKAIRGFCNRWLITPLGTKLRMSVINYCHEKQQCAV